MSDELILKDIWNSVAQFECIGLNQLPSESLMERIDRKFAVSISEISQFLAGLEKDYNIVKAAGSVVAPYHSLYLDTEGFKYFNKHRRGFSNRLKVRFRAYPKTQTSFLELKRKNNKGRTSKTRIPLNDFEYPLSQDSIAFLKSFIPASEIQKLNKSVEVDYDRLGFISKNGEERFSVDFNIRASYEGRAVSFGDLAIVEVKQDKYSSSPVVRQLREKGIREVSMSKYCIALSLLNPELKSNTFKPSLHRLRKIDNETIYET